MPKRVTHLIVGLGKGGAETMLYQLLKNKTEDDVFHSVISMGAADYYEDKIKALGIPVTTISIKKHPLKLLSAVRRAAKTMMTTRMTKTAEQP